MTENKTSWLSNVAPAHAGRRYSESCCLRPSGPDQPGKYQEGHQTSSTSVSPHYKLRPSEAGCSPGKGKKFTCSIPKGNLGSVIKSLWTPLGLWNDDYITDREHRRYELGWNFPRSFWCTWFRVSNLSELGRSGRLHEELQGIKKLHSEVSQRPTK